MAENIGAGPDFMRGPQILRAPDSSTGGPLDKGNEVDKAKEQADAANDENMRVNRPESLSDELIRGATTPEELFRGLRLLEKQLEESFIPPNLNERYSPPRQLSTMYERAEMLHYTIKEMQDLGWIKGYDPKTGIATLRDERFAALALKTEYKEVPKGQFTTERVPVYYFGRSEEGQTDSAERRVLEKAYRKGMVELAARDIMGEHWGVRDNTEIRDSLENLTAIMHGGRMPKFKAEHLESIFNLASIEELSVEGRLVDKLNDPNLSEEDRLKIVTELNAERGKERNGLGRSTEEAVFCNLIMLSSGNKQRMIDLMARPGAKDLIKRLADKAGLGYDDWVTKYIGHVEKWTDDAGVEHPGWAEDVDRDFGKTWREEAADGRRGLLTKWSNIAAWGGEPGEFSKEKEDEFIEKIIGEAVGSVEASWLAVVMMRDIGAYASEGYVALSDGRSLLPLGEGRRISGDDTGKFWAYMFNMKEGGKGRTSGLKDMVGRIPDMAMNLFDWGQVEVTLQDGTLVRRSIWDAWLGTAEQDKKDILTGGPVEIKKYEKIEGDDNEHLKVFVKDEKTGKITELLGARRKITDPKTREEKEIIVEKARREEGMRLGEVKFKTLEAEFHNTFTIMQWLMGNERGPTGVFIEAMNVEDFKFEDFSLNKLKKIWKYIDIVMNPVILSKGSTHLFGMGEKIRDQVSLVDLGRDEKGNAIGKVNIHETDFKEVAMIKRRYFINLMAARIRSAAFMFNILTRTVDIPNPGTVGGATIAVPQANLVELFVKEAMRDMPDRPTEADVLLHYIDDIARVGGVDKDPKKAIEIRDRAAKWLTKTVGRVTGKKTT